ncbi:MAG: sugar phosphate isomerase/epimerase [Kiritimatiellae bacterium]|nr:sugar phosphate isomerase/epimerase [Kiritimatiellia bacterium]
MKISRPVGVSTCCVPNPDGALLESLARAGVACAELSLGGEAYADFPSADFARHARDCGVRIRSFHLPFWTPETIDPASLDADVRRRTAALHARLLGVAAGMGAGFAVVHPGLEPVADAERAERLARSKESMAALAEVGAREGIVVCLENLPRSCLGNRAAELASILACDPRLRVCFDVNHLLGESHADFLARLGPLVATLHVSDYDFVNERHWLPGEGKIDWRALADGLDAIGYADAFTYELPFRGYPKSVARDRDLVPEDLVRNAREIEARADLTVHGAGGLDGLPMWP